MNTNNIYKTIHTLSRVNKRCTLSVRKKYLSTSPFADVQMGPPDPIIGLNDAFKQDTNPKKVREGVLVKNTLYGDFTTSKCTWGGKGKD